MAASGTPEASDRASLSSCVCKILSWVLAWLWDGTSSSPLDSATEAAAAAAGAAGAEAAADTEGEEAEEDAEDAEDADGAEEEDKAAALAALGFPTGVGVCVKRGRRLPVVRSRWTWHVKWPTMLTAFVKQLWDELSY